MQSGKKGAGDIMAKILLILGIMAAIVAAICAVYRFFAPVYYDGYDDEFDDDFMDDYAEDESLTDGKAHAGAPDPAVRPVSGAAQEKTQA